MHTIELTEEQLKFTIKIIRSKIKTYETMKRYDKKHDKAYSKEVEDKLKEFKELLEVYKGLK